MSVWFKRYCVAFSLILLLACGGGGGGSAPAPAPAPTPNLSLSQASHDFGGIVLDRSADRTFVIQNTGSGSLGIGTISISGSPFSIASDTCSRTTLAASATCTVRARFSPTSQSPFSGTMSIPSNDPDTATASIGLSGVGYGLSVWINTIDAVGCQVTADVTVTDPRGTLDAELRLLTTGYFTLHQGGQPITGFAATAIQYPSPVSLVLALDWSASTIGVLPNIRAAAKAFINLLSPSGVPPYDSAAIFKFNGAVESYPITAPPSLRSTDAAGKTALNGYIDLDFASTPGTLLYDAVFDSIERTTYGVNPKRAVIVLSDGVDESGSGPFPGSVKTLDEVISYSILQGVPVFAIFYVDPSYGGGGYGRPEILQRLAAETGGQYYNAATADLSAIFEQISNILSNKYTLTYTSPTCSGTVPVSIRADYSGRYGIDTRTVTLP